MLLIYHDYHKVTAVTNAEAVNIDKASKVSISNFLLLVAKEYPDSLLIWCHESAKEQLNISEIPKLFHHNKLLLSYNSCDTPFLDKGIGYVDESPFIRVNKKVPYATWQMSGFVGGMHASVLLALKSEISFEKDFDYFLSSLAKLGMREGLVCYSEPGLLIHNQAGVAVKETKYKLFRFVKQHYKTRWVFILLLNFMIYERRLLLLPFFRSFFYKKRGKNKINFDCIKVQSQKESIGKKTLDVIIPTIGRKKYLYDILCDLKSQTLPPKNVIIVEQNPDEASKSELDYLTNESWPFVIKHTFTHQSGACNARNIALEHITSDWVFFADDDIRITTSFIRKVFVAIDNLGVKAVSIRCSQKKERKNEKVVFQWMTFGAGCSFVFAQSLKDCKFNMGYEFGFGEDGDFGMQLRKQGCDILYLPEPGILHLKAPVGGFRTKPMLQWHEEDVQPKPAPTIMLYQILNNTTEQIRGYKTILFFKYYKHQKIKNPILYWVNFRKQWNQSVFWATQLNNW
ncbi:glycosyltransferase family 2 protein [Flavobacterium sp. ACAM 123]|uniref:glycosyltransferase family 2 protein n=1 Tax=Flavobacterium sp. ACAM 123 TaxID=1189620 RepID=UPI0002D55D94|nr:glycosyltransferase family A protein [Flavobacterium sp. ACAM 123]